MKRKLSWTLIPTALTMTLAIASTAHANPVQTPLSAPVTVTGSSGGAQSSSCGFVANSPNQVVVVNSPTPLRFRVQSQGQNTTLMVAGPGGRNQCAMADSFSNGSIEIPGVWDQGTYSVFVGDRVQGGSSSYTLSIIPEN